MNRGPLLFLGAFLALSLSWFGMILVPQLQFGGQNPGKAEDLGNRYPAPRPGDAQEGLQVYRASGCVYCHSQQIGQSGVSFDVMLTKGGDLPQDQASVEKEIMRVVPELATSMVRTGVANTNGFKFIYGLTKEKADAVITRISRVGKGVELVKIPNPEGGDLLLGWGARRSVARDYLYDYPVQLGSQRIGPDLSNIGSRKPDAAWHFKHLYSPRSKIPGSPMPRYEYLFTKREKGGERSPDALDFTDEARSIDEDYLPEADYEIIPTDDAKRLVAYLLSLQNGPRLFETPMPKARKKPVKTETPEEEEPKAKVASVK
jgi:cbb3-type cytochrome oxidase cytochrome c subunit